MKVISRQDISLEHTCSATRHPTAKFLPDDEHWNWPACRTTSDCLGRAARSRSPALIQRLLAHRPFGLTRPSEDFAVLNEILKHLVYEPVQLPIFHTEESFTPQKLAKISVVHECFCTAITRLQRTFLEFELLDPAASNSNVLAAQLTIVVVKTVSISHGHQNLVRYM